MHDDDQESRTSLNVSRNEVGALAGVVNLKSTVVPDAFETIADEDSIGRLRASELAPFDVINIDLCDSVADEPPLSGYYTALTQLLDLQRSRRPSNERWLLFLTTRARHPSLPRTDAESRRRFFESTINNMLEHDSVANAVETALGMDLNDIERMAQGEVDEDSILKFELAFGASIGKWLLGLLNFDPPFTLELLDTSCGYQIGSRSGGMDMLALAFSCRGVHQPAVDPAGLASSGVAVPQSESEAAVNLIERVPNIQWVDRLLDSDDALRCRLTDEMANLLGQAHYDVEAYYQWVASGYSSQDKTSRSSAKTGCS